MAKRENDLQRRGSKAGSGARQRGRKNESIRRIGYGDGGGVSPDSGDGGRTGWVSGRKAARAKGGNAIAAGAGEEVVVRERPESYVLCGSGGVKIGVG